MLTKEEIDLIKHLRDSELDTESYEAILDYVVRRLGDIPARTEPAPWTPKVGDRVETPRGDKTVVQEVGPDCAWVGTWHKTLWPFSQLKPAQSPDQAPQAAADVVPWTPKVGDMVVLTDSISDHHYKVEAVEEGRCRVSCDGNMVFGWFGFGEMAPADPPEPTAEQILARIEEKRLQLRPLGISCFHVHRGGRSYSGDTIAKAVMAEMKDNP